MENDDAIVGTILTRREALRATARVGIGLGIAGLIPRSLWADSPATQPVLPLVASPSMTEGPFFVDEKLNRSDLTTGTDRPSVINGLPFYLGFAVYKLSGKILSPMKDVQVDVWHADAIGVYSDEANRMNHDDTSHQTWLRGYQMTGGDGLAQFKTILTGWYPGRTPHVHFKIRQALPGTSTSAKPAVAEFTSQVFFRDDDLDRLYANAPYAARGKRRIRNADDGIYAEQQSDGRMAGETLLLDLKKSAKGDGLMATFPVILTDKSLAAGEEHHGPGGHRSGPGGRPPGPPPEGFDGPPPGPR